MKKIVLIFVLIVVFVAGIFIFTRRTPVAQSPTQTQTKTSADYKNISYQIEGQPVLLKNGSAETPAEAGSVETVDTDYFGNEVRGDFNGDGTQDVAFILTQGGGGTGVFYYAVAALKTADGYKGTNAIFLGDRIAPQTTEFRDGQVIVNYADRKSGEPFSAEPSVAVSKHLKISGNKLVEIP